MTRGGLSRRHAVAGLLAGATSLSNARADTWRERAERLLHRVTGSPDVPVPVTPSSATLLVGGPTDGGPEQLARLLAPLLAPTLLGPAPRSAVGDVTAGRVDIASTGGRDGVTAANAFEARASADGTTALVVPGAAVLAWLAGDPRCHFDAGTWVPAFATLAPVVLVGRIPTSQSSGPLMIGGAAPTGPMLPGLIALALLGIPVAPRFDLGPEDVPAALRAGTIDAAILSGADVPARSQALAAAGMPSAFALRPDNGRDPALPLVPGFGEALASAGRSFGGPLAGALRATSAAAGIDTAVVLPALAAASVVARWRAACGDASHSLALNAAATESAVRPAPAPDCVDAVRQVVASADTTLALRQWLAGRWGWNPV